jgi:hypothetical protein
MVADDAVDVHPLVVVVVYVQSDQQKMNRLRMMK